MEWVKFSLFLMNLIVALNYYYARKDLRKLTHGNGRWCEGEGGYLSNARTYHRQSIVLFIVITAIHIALYR